ncbi:MAG: hypothetical protein H0T11_02060 [Chthoniobacterales bacterium]|nr:hypothetical protein [Chthoniobacterales bacterium]
MTSISALRSFLAVSSVFVALDFARATSPQLYPLEIKEGKLAGAGAKIIRGELANALFILWGEDHGFADSPILLRALAREARPLGFKYHVVEVGPVSTRLIADKLTRGGLPALHELVHEVRSGFRFSV